MSEQALQGIRAHARAWSVDIPEAACIALRDFLHELLRWNARVNLTGAKDLNDLLGEHLDDSFALARLIPAGCSVVDVGSGGGLPAVPLAILRPDLSFVLVEPRAKRVAFLRSMLRLVPKVLVEHGRWEDSETRGFDVAVSRATFAPTEWLSAGRQLVGTNGLVMVLAAAPIDGSSAGARLDGSLSYQTAEGHGRWTGAFRFN